MTGSFGFPRIGWLFRVDFKFYLSRRKRTACKVICAPRFFLPRHFAARFSDSATWVCMRALSSRLKSWRLFLCLLYRVEKTSESGCRDGSVENHPREGVARETGAEIFLRIVTASSYLLLAPLWLFVIGQVNYEPGKGEMIRCFPKDQPISLHPAELLFLWKKEIRGDTLMIITAIIISKNESFFTVIKNIWILLERLILLEKQAKLLKRSTFMEILDVLF